MKSNSQKLATKVARFRTSPQGPDEQFVCFYCRGHLQQGTGRKFRTVEGGPVWEVHSRHAVIPSEITVPIPAPEG